MPTDSTKIDSLKIDSLKMDSTTTLNDGHRIPLFGLGVFQSPSGALTVDSVSFALENGYRHIDTARIYNNEKDVGTAIAQSGVARENIFVTTKLWNQDQGYDSALRAFDESLSRLAMEYVDLYLIHWPLNPEKRKESWRALIKIKESGRAKSIGVSNFTIKHLQGFLDFSNVVPAVNQVEFSPFLFQKDLLHFCAKHKIQLEAYSPLTRGARFSHKVLQTIAKKYKKTPAQILIRWCLEHKVVVIPKSNRHERILENAHVFDFSIGDDDLRTLDGLNEDYRTSWDPTNVD